MDVFSFLTALAAGLSAGLSGVLPFVHSNSLASFFQGVFSNPLYAAVFFAALGAAHLVFSSLPAVFFGLPSQAQGISVLPAHALAQEGKGLTALYAMLYAAFGAFILALALSPALHFFSQAAYAFFSQFTLPTLAAIVALFFISEKNITRASAGLLVFLLSGVFGFIVLSFSFVAQPLLPLLTGLFGLPLLFLSFSSKRPPHQSLVAVVPSNNLHVFSGVLLGAASTFVPAVSPAVASSAAFLLLGESTPLQFLSMSTALSASKTVFDVASVFSIGKARSGVAAAVQQSLGGFGEHWLILVAAAVSGLAAIALTLLACKPAAKAFHSLPGKKVSFLILAAVVVGLFLSGGAWSLAIVAVACAIGLVPPLAGLRHAYLTGALILPTLLYYAGLSTQLVSLIRGL